MDAFNFVFSLFGLLLGLALAEVLGGFGAALQERHKIRIGWLTPLLGLVVACDLTTFWLFAWFSRKLVPANYLVLLCALVVTSIYYLAARLVFPHDRAEWPDYDVYYFAHRRWVIGGIVLSNLLLAAGELALGLNPYDLLIDKMTGVLFFGQAIALMLLRSRRFSIALLAFWLVQYPEAAIYSFVTHCGDPQSVRSAATLERGGENGLLDGFDGLAQGFGDLAHQAAVDIIDSHLVEPGELLVPPTDRARCSARGGVDLLLGAEHEIGAVLGSHEDWNLLISSRAQ